MRWVETGATATGAKHLMPLAFLDKPIFRIQFAPPVRVSNFVNSVGNSSRASDIVQRINLFVCSSNLRKNGFVPPRR